VSCQSLTPDDDKIEKLCWLVRPMAYPMENGKMTGRE